MAQKRMFSLTVIDTDCFIDMPMSARLLYYELGMRADDDGFVSAPKKIVKMVGCSEDDLKLLISKSFVICFDSGVVVIRHWKINNYLRADRYKPTIYTQEREQLITDNEGIYNLSDGSGIPVGIPTHNQMDTQYSIDKNSNNIVEQDSTTHLSEIKEIVDYLNTKAGTSYRHTTKNTQKHIKARLKENYTVADFKRVIDSRVKAWGSDKDMQQYLRPDTLFGTKFESYLQNVDVSATENDMFRGYNKL